MSIRRNIIDRITNDTVAVRHGHTYVDKVTGERFKVISVGNKTQIKRLDADRRPENYTRTETIRSAIRSGTVEHDTKKCTQCGE